MGGLVSSTLDREDENVVPPKVAKGTAVVGVEAGAPGAEGTTRAFVVGGEPGSVVSGAVSGVVSGATESTGAALTAAVVTVLTDGSIVVGMTGRWAPAEVTSSLDGLLDPEVMATAAMMTTAAATPTPM